MHKNILKEKIKITKTTLLKKEDNNLTPSEKTKQFILFKDKSE